MPERLKQIWGGFEGATTRRLVGGGVDNIHVPARRETSATDSHFLPEDFTPPAEAAFAALKAKLSAHEQRLAKKRGRNGAAYAPPAPLSPEAEDAGAPEAARDLIRGLKATDARVARSLSDYGQNDGAARQKKRKLFGIF